MARGLFVPEGAQPGALLLVDTAIAWAFASGGNTESGRVAAPRRTHEELDGALLQLAPFHAVAEGVGAVAPVPLPRGCTPAALSGADVWPPAAASAAAAASSEPPLAALPRRELLSKTLSANAFGVGATDEGSAAGGA
jgi:hypothetical protein